MALKYKKVARAPKRAAPKGKGKGVKFPAKRAGSKITQYKHGSQPQPQPKGKTVTTYKSVAQPAYTSGAKGTSPYTGAGGSYTGSSKYINARPPKTQTINTFVPDPVRASSNASAKNRSNEQFTSGGGQSRGEGQGGSWMSGGGWSGISGSSATGFSTGSAKGGAGKGSSATMGSPGSWSGGMGGRTSATGGRSTSKSDSGGGWAGGGMGGKSNSPGSSGWGGSGGKKK